MLTKRRRRLQKKEVVDKILIRLQHNQSHIPSMVYLQARQAERSSYDENQRYARKSAKYD